MKLLTHVNYPVGSYSTSSNKAEDSIRKHLMEYPEYYLIEEATIKGVLGKKTVQEIESTLNAANIPVMSISDNQNGNFTAKLDGRGQFTYCHRDVSEYGLKLTAQLENLGIKLVNKIAIQVGEFFGEEGEWIGLETEFYEIESFYSRLVNGTKQSGLSNTAPAFLYENPIFHQNEGL